MAIRFSNNAQTTLASGITAAATSISVADGSVFPALTPGDHTYVTLEDTSGNLEIVKVTAISSNTLTVTRGQDGTTAQAFSSGDFVQLRVTAALLNDLADEASVTLWADVQNKPDPVITLAGDASGSVTLADLASATLTVTVTDDSHTHDGRYYTETEADTRFVNVTGDTLTGRLVFAEGGYSISDDLHVWKRNYTVSLNNPEELLYHDGNSLPNGGAYRFHAHISATGTDQSATAVYWNENGTWKVNVTYQSGVSSNHPEFIVGANGKPHISIDHSGAYIIEVLAERLELGEGTGTDNKSGFGADAYMSEVQGALRHNPNGGANYTSGDRVFTDGYHPNADAWTTSRTLALSGDVTGSVSWDGSANATLATTIADDSHNHVIANVDGLQAALDAKLPSSSYTAADVLTKIKTVDGVGSGLDADTVDGIQGSVLLRSDTNQSIAYTSKTSWYSNTNGASTSGSQSSLEVYSPTANTDAFMTFHVSGDYAGYFGLDGTTNDLFWGGWSRGAAKYRIWHAANDGSGSGLDADLLDGLNSSQFLRSDTSDTISGNLTVDNGTSTTLSVKCDNEGLALIRANGDGQGTGAIEVGQADNYGGGISYNGDGSPAFVSGETSDAITFYRLDAGTRTEVFYYPYSSNDVVFNGSITSSDIRVNNANTALSQGSGNALRITTNSGYVDIGPMNGTYSHFSTDRGKFYFNQPVHFDGQIYNYIGGGTTDPYWRAGNDGSGSGLDADLLDGVQAAGFMRQLSDTTSPNYTTPSSRRVDPNSSNPTNAHHAIVTFGNDGNVTGQLATHFVSGQPYTRGYNTSWSSWRTIWTDANDGSGSGLDADLLDGQHGSYYQPASTAITTGNIGSQSVSSASNIDGISFRNGNSSNGIGPDYVQENGTGYINSVSLFGQTDGALYSQAYSTAWVHQIFGDYRTGNLAVRGRLNGTWQSWKTVWTSANDGSGSGLDADTVDGLNSSSFLRSDTQATSSASLILANNWGQGTYNGQFVIQGTYPSWETRGDASQPYGWLHHQDGSGNYTLYSIAGYNNNSWTQRFTFNHGDQTFRNGGPSGNVYYHQGNDGSGSGLDADLLDGLQLHTGRNNEVNKVVRTDSNGYIQAGWINTTSGQMGSATAPDRVYCSNDGYIRYAPATNFIHKQGTTYYQAGNWIDFQSSNGAGLYWSANTGAGWHIHPTATGNMRLRSGEATYCQIELNTTGTSRAHIYADSSHNAGWLNSGAGWRMRLPSSGSFIRYEGSTQYTMWDSGNDGSGSGLDADTLDGYHHSTFWKDNEDRRISVLRFSGEGGNSSHGTISYGIFQEGGAWSNPYPDLHVGYHTGIKIGGYYGYNGTRFYDDAPSRSGAAKVMSVADGSNNVNIDNTTYSYAYRGNGNVGGTGEASYHPAGIYSTGTNWLYGTMYMNGNSQYMSGGSMFSTNRIVCDQNYGEGVYGVYSSYRYQHVWMMSTSYKLASDGTGVGNAYGMSYTHPNVGTGTNQAIAGLSHQLQGREAGSLVWALGTGIWTAYNITAYSDRAVKTNLEVIPDALSKVCQLNGYTYDRTDYKPDPLTGTMPETRQAGVVAQEVELVLPEVVSGEEGNKAVAYGNMVALLIEAIKELKAEVNDLKAQLESK